ncbi:hypothetical protein [Cellulomonas hominis]|uniref:hypothetical protein n=1 Tax=Cellulomonas hominis TaxID=156981 RepID=UPI001BA0A11C|nr:hypothetical protein [Cellulomonas hominis]VTR77044.1 hypothetical protein CHMI_01812 [Cellulomonas hominis]
MYWTLGVEVADVGGRAGWRHAQLTTVLRAVRGRVVPPAPRKPGAAAGVAGAGLADAGAGAGARHVGAHAGARVGTSEDPAAGHEGAARHRASASLIDPAALDALDPRRRRQVLAPLDVPLGRTVRWSSAAARQVDGTTCGAAVLGMLAAAGDPALAYWLVTGRAPDGVLPPELTGLDLTDPPAPHDPDAPEWFRTPDGRAAHADATGEEAAAARWGLLQAALHRRSTARALGPFPWPRALGTPPWGAARLARFPGVAYRSVLVDDTRTAEVDDVLARVDSALDRGVPVPLYSGGDLADGLGAAVPRHVVLAVGRTDDGYRVYEPGAGAVLPVERAALREPAGPVPGLGSWTHLAWALLPVRPRSTA